MRLILLGLVVSGCVTAGQVHEARVAQVSCLDDRIARLKLANVLSENMEQARIMESDCWRLYSSEVKVADSAAPTTAASCRSLLATGNGFAEQLAETNAQLSRGDGRCEAAKEKADNLQSQREGQAAAVDAALLGIQATGQARQDAAAVQASAPRPIHCSSTQSGAQVYTTCQ